MELTLPTELSEDLIREFPDGEALNCLIMERYYGWQKRLLDYQNGTAPEVSLLAPDLLAYLERAGGYTVTETDAPVTWADTSMLDVSRKPALRFFDDLLAKNIQVLVAAKPGVPTPTITATLTYQHFQAYAEGESFPLALCRAALLLWFYQQPGVSYPCYMDPYLLETGVFASRKEYDETTDSIIGRIEAGLTQPHAPDPDEDRP